MKHTEIPAIPSSGLPRLVSNSILFLIQPCQDASVPRGSRALLRSSGGAARAWRGPTPGAVTLCELWRLPGKPENPLFCGFQHESIQGFQKGLVWGGFGDNGSGLPGCQAALTVEVCLNTLDFIYRTRSGRRGTAGRGGDTSSTLPEPLPCRGFRGHRCCKRQSEEKVRLTFEPRGEHNSWVWVCASNKSLIKGFFKIWSQECLFSGVQGRQAPAQTTETARNL